MIDSVTNKNLKELLVKRKLTPEVLMEIKTSYFFHPSQPADEENYYYYTYSPYMDGEVLYLFTDYDEFIKYYDNENDLKPLFWHLYDFKNSFYADTLGIIINPATDNLFIAKSLVIHMIKDIIENNSCYEYFGIAPSTFSDNSFLHYYCRGKKSFKQYPNLFSYLDSSVIYTLICSSNSLDEYLDNDKLKIDDVEASFYKINSYYVLFSDMDLLFKEIENKEGYFYYLIADVIHIARLTFEFDYEGIILKTPEGEFILPRKNLLKNYEGMSRKYKKRENSHVFAYRLEE